VTENVLVGIKGLHTATGEDPVEDDIEVIFPGTARRLGNTWYVRYSEPVEGLEGEISSLIKISEKHMEVTKRGLANTHMVFEEGKKTTTWYETPMGSITLGIAATEVTLREDESGLLARAVYALDVNAQHTADCAIQISVSERDRASNIGRDYADKRI
jgi:uncharacterized beta-barrel protein YwiB (DUF1934 family)